MKYDCVEEFPSPTASPTKEKETVPVTVPITRSTYMEQSSDSEEEPEIYEVKDLEIDEGQKYTGSMLNGQK